MSSCFLDTKFPDIPEDGKINTAEFLKACDKIVEFFDILGGRMFAPVKNDVAGNVAKIRARLEECDVKFGTLHDIVENELKETDKSKKQSGQGIATNALMWLRRGLRFIYLFFVHLIKEDYMKDAKGDRNILKNCAIMAYDESLRVYHGFIVGNVFKLAMLASPTRDRFMRDLSGNKDTQAAGEFDEGPILGAIKEFNVNFESNIQNIEVLFKEKKVESDAKV